jgi:hypothetical protein
VLVVCSVNVKSALEVDLALGAVLQQPLVVSCGFYTIDWHLKT